MHDNNKEHDMHAGHSAKMFRDKFLLTFVLTIPVILYSESVQSWWGFHMPEFPGFQYIPLLLCTFIFFYGGMVFIRGAVHEIRHRQPGMMTLITLAIVTSYAYSVSS